MKESYVEGLATHDDPESCGGIREDAVEAFDRGTCGPGIEPRNQPNQGADDVKRCGKQHAPGREREVRCDPARSETPSTYGTSLRENREISGLPSTKVGGRVGKAKSRTPTMNGPEKSDGLIVPTKPPNEAGLQTAKEVVEGRSPAKGNTREQNASRTQNRTSAPSALDRVREVARKDRKVKFTALLHHVTIDRLRNAFLEIKHKAAAGVDGVTWDEYGQDLETHLGDLHARIHRGAYRAKPSRRVYIPKPDGRQRPLGIAALEDKVVQRAVVEVLNAIYEVDFLGFSYGFRPGRGQHNALDAIATAIARKKVSWVLDADIRGFFDNIDHGWLVKFLGHRIADSRIIRLIQKWLAAGVLEAGKWSPTEEGTPQGATASPLLANVYLHYVLDLWVQHWRKHQARGEVVIVRYADDFVLGFQYEDDATRFRAALQIRLEQFGLEVHPDKTRLFRFGRYAERDRRESGEGKPETFQFLGFTHVCGKSRNGKFLLHRHTSSKRMRAKLKQIREELMGRRHQPVPVQGQWLQSVVRGYFAYHAVPTNIRRLTAFRTQVIRSWHHALRRRSQRDQTTWEKTNRLSIKWIPPARMQHPLPWVRFEARTQGKSRVR
jgi:RNA-directed DNA polymerase